jgi:hypothetical protein
MVGRIAINLTTEQQTLLIQVYEQCVINQTAMRHIPQLYFESGGPKLSINTIMKKFIEPYLLSKENSDAAATAPTAPSTTTLSTTTFTTTIPTTTVPTTTITITKRPLTTVSTTSTSAILEIVHHQELHQNEMDYIDNNNNNLNINNLNLQPILSTPTSTVFNFSSHLFRLNEQEYLKCLTYQ